MVELLRGSSAELEPVYAIDAPNWVDEPNKDIIKIGVSKTSLQGRANRGLRHVLGQFYGVLDPGLIMAQHVFQGLRRSMHTGGEHHAAQHKLAVTWAASKDAFLAGDKADPTLEFSDAPDSKVFAVYISVNRMLDEYPSIYGWAEHWTWLQADPVELGAPIQWMERYDKRVWRCPTA